MGFVSEKRGSLGTPITPIFRNRKANIMSEVYYIIFQLIMVVVVLAALIAYTNNVATDLGFEKRFTSIDMALLTTVVYYAPGTMKHTYTPIQGIAGADGIIQAGFAGSEILVVERSDNPESDLPGVAYWILADKNLDPFRGNANLRGRRTTTDMVLFSLDTFIPPNITFHRTGRKISFSSDSINALHLVCPTLNTTDPEWRSNKVFIAKVFADRSDASEDSEPANRVAQILSARESQFEISGSGAGSAGSPSDASLISAIPEDAKIVIAIGDAGDDREPGSLVVYFPADRNVTKGRKLACMVVNDILSDGSLVFYAQAMPVYPSTVEDGEPLSVFNERSSEDQVMVFIDISNFEDEQVDVDNLASAISNAVERYYGGYDVAPVDGVVLDFGETVTPEGSVSGTGVAGAGGVGAGSSTVLDRDIASVLSASGGQLLSDEEKYRMLAAAGSEHDFEFATLRAFLIVEAGGRGFGPDGRLKIRMEPHVFNDRCERTEGTWGDEEDPDNTRTNRAIAGVSCQGGQEHEHACLAKAAELEPECAFKAISMGLPQIMGFHATRIGYDSPVAMFEDFSRSEAVQIEKFVVLLDAGERISAAIRAKDWDEMARIYNGDTSGRYSGRLQQNYDPSLNAQYAVA